jgi:hypothetical protein
MFCAPVLVFEGTEGVVSRFNVVCCRSRFRRCRIRQVPFSYFARPNSFSAVPKASGPVFMFCAPRLVFGGADCLWSRFHVLHARTHFRRYRGRQVPLSCFVLPDSFSAVPSASGPVFMFCAPGIVFGSTEVVGSCFHVLCSRTSFQRCRVRRVPFSNFAHPYSFSAVTWASSPVFMFSDLRLVFGGTEGVRPCFHVLRSQTHFRRYRVRRVPFSCFARPDSFSAVTSASGPVIMFCAPRHFFDGTEGVRYFFHVLCARTPFRRYQMRRVPFSYLARPDSFSALPRTSGPVFMFFCTRTRFRRYRGR